jgi:hypothetical protein
METTVAVRHLSEDTVKGSGRGGQQQRARKGGVTRTKPKKNLVVSCVGRLCQLYKWSAPRHHTRGGIHPTTVGQ